MVDGNMLKKIPLMLALIVIAQNATASELFGLQIKSATPEQFRTALKQAGASIIQKSDENRPYDIFDSRELMPGSSLLYIGHAGDNQQTAFVEYEFVGLQQKAVLRLLSRKYGSPVVRNAKYISDKSYYWDLNGIRVTLWSDWKSFRTRLSYVVPESMALLQKVGKETTVDSSYY